MGILGKLLDACRTGLLNLAGWEVEIMLRLLERLCRIRIGLIEVHRIGTLAQIPEVFLRKRAIGVETADTVDLFFCTHAEICNRPLMAMIRRRLRVFEGRQATDFYLRALRRRIAGSRFEAQMTCRPRVRLGRVPPQLAFTPEEKRRGENLLREMGIPEGKPFVCFHARDHLYLDRMFPHQTREQWAYHDYRDSDIRNYVPAMDYLAGRGIRGIRMGSVVKDRLETAHPLIVDYATTRRSEFGDVYLSGHCKFFISGGSGLAHIAAIFNRPVAIVNAMPVSDYAEWWKEDDVYIPKKLRHVEKNRFLTLKETIELGADLWNKSSMFADAGLEVVENTPEEILGIAREMNDRIDGVRVETDEDRRRQDHFQSLISRRLSPEISNPLRIGADFLRRNPDFLA